MDCCANVGAPALGPGCSAHECAFQHAAGFAAARLTLAVMVVCQAPDYAPGVMVSFSLFLFVCHHLLILMQGK